MKKGFEKVKRLLSLVMVFAMVLAMAPVTVHAANHTGGRVYFETDWDANCVQLMIGHSSWSQGYEMTKGTGNLYYVDVPTWNGAYDFAVFGTESVWGGEGNSITHRKNWAPNSTGVDTSGYQFNAGSKYLITSTGVDDISVKVVYDVTVSDAANGTVIADKVLAGDTDIVTLTVTPDTGYELEKVTVMNGTNEVTVTENKFTMPAGNVTVSATFQKLPAEYSVTFNGTNVTSNGASTVTEGTAYTATLTAAEGYILPENVSVQIGEADPKDYTLTDGVLTIPADDITGDITITAVGVEEQKDITVYCINSAQWDQVAAYAWITDGASNAGWPGAVMTKTSETVNGFDVYMATFDTEYANIIFNNNGNGSQTADLTLQEGKYYDVKGAAWYDSLADVPTVDPLVTGIYLAGSFNDWNTTANEFKLDVEGSKTGYVSLELAANTEYQFKIVKSGTWTGYSNLTVTCNVEGIQFTNSAEDNIVMTTTEAAAYTFAFNAEASTLVITYPEPVKAEYNVTFDGGETVESAGSVKATEGTEYTATLTVAEGYTLTKDDITVEVGGTPITTHTFENNVLTIPADSVKGNISITAEAVQNTYTVTFNTNGGSEVKEQTVAHNGTVEKPADDPTKDSNLFAGWYSDEGLTKAYDFTSKVTGDVTLYAKWTPSKTVYFQNNWNWTDVKIHYWGSTTGTNTEWNGIPMTFVENDGTYDIYSAEIPADATGMVFNGTKDNGSGTDQSPDITNIQSETVCYYMFYETDHNEVKTFTYPVVEGEKETYTAIFHFANTIGWSPVNLYVWNGDGASTGNWPGTAMSRVDENGYYTMTVSYDSASNQGLNYIFNNSTQQTVDLSLAASAFDAENNTAEIWVKLDPTKTDSNGKITGEGVTTAAEAFGDVLLAVSPKVSGTSVTFEYAGDANTTSVEVRGTVPGASWDVGIPMTKNEKGLWTVTVENLTPAVYEYKFVVNNEVWTADPANGKTNSVGNSVFTILDPNAKDTNTVNIHVYYDRTDKIYVQANADGDATGTWNAYVWGDGITSGRYDFAADTQDLNADEDMDQMVTTITVQGRDTQAVYLKMRMSTEAKEWLREEGQVSIPLDNIVSGTIFVYVTSDGQYGKAGTTSYSVVTGTDIVAKNKITGVSFDYDTGKVVVTTLEPLSDPMAELQVANEFDNSDDIAITSIKTNGNTYTLTLSKTPELTELYRYKVLFDSYYYAIAVDDAYASDKFAEEYTYTGDDLGANYSASGTTFKVWAPTAESVDVLLYNAGNGGEKIGTHAMTRGDNGVWSVTVPGDLDGTYYTYSVKVNGETVEAVDPYARTTGVNGSRGMVVDLDSTDPEGWATDSNPNPVTSQTDAIIYELHVRDFSNDASSGVSAENRGKYLAFTETGTTVNGAGAVPTGVDYLKDLGITHLHLLPVYDYGSVDETTCSNFNWGYDPVNYNVPEGSYSTDPYNGAVRVNEFKQMVASLHANGISVVMDVVYNHVYNAEKFCFNNIVPGYFSRPDSNASGCGNDTASEREMVSKYIVDSILYWTEEYHIDGFRFDLVGLIDADTIKTVVEEVHKTRPDVIFYGEGWDMDSTNKEEGTEMAKQHNASLTPGFAYFSDSMRDNLAGSNGSSLGFVSGGGNEAAIAENFLAKASSWGSVWTTNPQQIVQYVSCHDNYTLADKLIVSTNASGITDNIVKMNNLSAAVYMTAQGIPFIHAGEELLREKLYGSERIHNSYNYPDSVNNIDWTVLLNETYADTSDYYEGLIDFRKAHPALRYETAALVADNVTNTTAAGGLLTFRVDGYGAGDDDIFIIFNANKSARTVELPAGDWTIYINGEDAGTTALGTASGSVSVAAISAMVLTKPDQGEDEDEPLAATGEKTIYFTNNKRWDKVYAYAWTDNGDKLLLGEWPGTQMTYVETNGYGEDIYAITLPASETGIEGVIFSNGSDQQTVDIVPGVDGIGYYCSDQSGSKWNVGTYTYRASDLGEADEYFLIGYINSADYVGSAYKFDENGQIKAAFTADSYVYVVNGTNTETYMTDGYQGSVTSAVLKDTAKNSLTADKWDKLLIPGGVEATITMVKNNDNTVTLSYEMDLSGVEDTSGVQDGVTLHCWNWSFSEIEKNMAAIAELGYTAIQTSPVQVMKEATNLSTNSVGSHWWVYYQPVDFEITTDSGNALGTKADLESMIRTAHAYGIQVIVDVVANHLGNESGNDLSPKIPLRLSGSDYWHDLLMNISNYEDRFEMTQYCMGGLPDLETSNDVIQGYVLDFLKECVDLGVDGFRFDAAKHIETPEDDASFASDFWPTVVGGAEEYAQETYGKDLYIYGEVLDNPVIFATAYTEYMAITDNSWGNNLRNAIVSGTAALSEGYHKAADASNLVIWAESHDTYATDDAAQSSYSVSEAQINMTWALVAARADAMGLYLARPESMDQALGVASVTGWDNAEVKAANLFHNAFVGQSEAIGNENGISYVERGTTGVVLVNVKGGAADVSVTAKAMEDGTYTDQITGNIFTVADGKITGKIGDTGIAVVYNRTEYKIIKGAGSTWTQGSAAGQAFTANGDYVKFTGVSVDGKLLSTAGYESKSGSTVVTLKVSFLDTLSVGEHTLTVHYVDGSASCSFFVEAASSTETSTPDDGTTETSTPDSGTTETSAPGDGTTETSAPDSGTTETQAPETTAPETTVPGTTAPGSATPPTGDDSGIFFWSAMLLLCAAGAAALIGAKKRFGEEE